MSPPVSATWPAPGSRAAGLGDQGQHRLVGLAHRGRAAAGDLGVRLVDQPDVGHGQHRARDDGAEGVERGVVVVLGVALPRGGVEHRAAGARREHGRRAQVELRAAGADQAVGVELEQAGGVALHGGRAGDEDAVVGLGVVAGHALLVALAVVDVDVQAPAVEQRLEVEHRVVAVQDDVGVQLGVELGEVAQRDRGQHGQRGAGLDDAGGGGIAHDDGHRQPLVEDLQHRQPLHELVGARGVVREVGDDGDRVHERMLDPGRRVPVILVAGARGAGEDPGPGRCRPGPGSVGTRGRRRGRVSPRARRRG